MMPCKGSSDGEAPQVLMARPALPGQAALLSRPWHLLASRGSSELLFCTQKDLVLALAKADVQECPQMIKPLCQPQTTEP